MRHAVRVAAALLLWPALTVRARPPAPTRPGGAATPSPGRRGGPLRRRQRPPSGQLSTGSWSVVASCSRCAIALGARSVPSRRHLDRVAARAATPAVSPISASVLDPVPLEQLAPDLVVALPPDATLADGQALMDLALDDGHWSDDVQAYDVLSVLVHDLRFTVSTAHPAALVEGHRPGGHPL